MNTTLPTPTAAAEHVVTHLSGGRADEDWTAQCSCGTRRPPVHVQPVTREDIETAYVWGMTLTEWYALTEFERRECRRTVTTAPRFKVTA